MELIEGPISRHYFVCPFCLEASANLDTHACSSCGAQVTKILWTKPNRGRQDISPELVMVGRHYR